LITAVVVVVVVIIAVAGYFVWDRRYRGGGKGEFRPTDEVFLDPASGKLTRVWEDPSTGRREYREEPPA
jgi:hypothetical protein